MAEATRPSRAEETRRARRMKPGSVVAAGVKLGVDETKLDRNTYEYRWVKTDRVEQMKRRDWDPVDENVKEDSTGVGTIPTAHGGIGENGKPYDLILMQKYRDWYDADQKEKQKSLDEMDNAIRRGTDQKEADLRGVSYTPEGGNTLSR